MRGLIIAGVVLAAAAADYGVYLYAKQRDDFLWVRQVTNGDAARAVALMHANGCAGCHTIPDLPGAEGTVGPSLDKLAERSFIGGTLTNTADNLVAWIRHSRQISPHTAMPNTDVSEQDARDIAAFLYDPCHGADILRTVCLR